MDPPSVNHRSPRASLYFIFKGALERKVDALHEELRAIREELVAARREAE